MVDIVIPPLRERKEDIPLLIDFFLKKYNLKHRKNIKGLTREARDVLVRYDYPGNVRELENIVERATVLTRGDHISSEDLPNVADQGMAASDGSIRGTVESVERSMIIEALVNADWVQTKAAGALGLSERMLRYKIKKYGIAKSARPAG